MEVSVLEPEPEKPAEKPPEAQPEPAPPPPPPPPPQPVVEEPPKPEEPPPKEIEPVMDEGENQNSPQKAPPPPVSETAAEKFRACLEAKTSYPSSREARKSKPHGVVAYIAVVENDQIARAEIITGSGSEILDNAALATVLKSKCGLLGESGTVQGRIRY